MPAYVQGTPPPDETTVSNSDFRIDLERLINSHSKENGSDTPDFILANYLIDCLEAFDRASKARQKWHTGSERISK